MSSIKKLKEDMIKHGNFSEEQKNIIMKMDEDTFITSIMTIIMAEQGDKYKTISMIDDDIVWIKHCMSNVSTPVALDSLRKTTSFLEGVKEQIRVKVR